MLGAAEIVAFLATGDAARARDFYEKRLGLKLVSDDDFALVFDAGGVELRVQKVAGFKPQPHTALGFSVAAIDDAVAWLAAKGVTLQCFDFIKADGRGVWTSPSGAKVAWFKDPDGNLLSLTEPPAG